LVFDPDKQVYLCRQGKVLERSARSQPNRCRVYAAYHARLQKRLDHFALRAKRKVEVQWQLFAPFTTLVKSNGMAGFHECIQRIAGQNPSDPTTLCSSACRYSTVLFGASKPDLSNSFAAHLRSCRVRPPQCRRIL
jgi:hypothetical protein